MQSIQGPLLNEWLAEGFASDNHDFISSNVSPYCGDSVDIKSMSFKSNVGNFYLLKIHLTLFEIPNQVLKFENLI